MPVKKKKTVKKKVEEQSAFSTAVVPEVSSGRADSTKKLFIAAGAILTLIVILIIGSYYYLNYQKSQQLLKNPLLASEKEQETLVANVGKLTQLPNELPTIAKVSDITKLQGQLFFQHAKNGDMVLIYPKAKEAILYDPTANKIVQIGPINLDPSAKGTSGAASQKTLGAQTTAQPIRIVIENGTTIAGLAKKTEQSLQQTMKHITVVAEGNAVKQDYSQTIIVDVSGSHSADASQLAGFLHGLVGTLPSGEVKPTNADILVILGQQ